MKRILMAGACALALCGCADPGTFSTDVTNLTQNAGAVAGGAVTVANEVAPVIPVLQSTACLILEAVGGSWKPCTAPAPATTTPAPG